MHVSVHRNFSKQIHNGLSVGGNVVVDNVTDWWSKQLEAYVSTKHRHLTIPVTLLVGNLSCHITKQLAI